MSRLDTDLYFSGSTFAFIPAAWKDDGTYTSDSWPKDAVILTDGEISEYRNAPPPERKELGVSDDGRPCWIDIPPPPPEEQVARAHTIKEALQREAEDAIKPLERAKQLGIATDAELALLLEWEKYSVFLMRVDTSTAPDIAWPLKP